MASMELSDFAKDGANIGGGSFGTVQRVLHKETGKAYAIKTVPRSKISENGMEVYLRREVETQMKLDHPSILRLYRCFEDAVNYQLLLEYADGGSLFGLMRRKGCLPSEKAAPIFAGVADALDHLHQMGLIHRDVKPENILLCGSVAKLADFGWCAQMAAGEKRQTFCGTLDYLPPEMIKNDPHDCTVDNWAMGVLLYEMLIGKAPFSEGSKTNLARILEADVNDFPEGAMPTEAEALMRELLKPEPSERLALAAALEHEWVERHTDRPRAPALVAAPPQAASIAEAIGEATAAAVAAAEAEEELRAALSRRGTAQDHHSPTADEAEAMPSQAVEECGQTQATRGIALTADEGEARASEVSVTPPGACIDKSVLTSCKQHEASDAQPCMSFTLDVTVAPGASCPRDSDVSAAVLAGESASGAAGGDLGVRDNCPQPVVYYDSDSGSSPGVARDSDARLASRTLLDSDMWPSPQGGFGPDAGAPGQRVSFAQSASTPARDSHCSLSAHGEPVGSAGSLLCPSDSTPASQTSQLSGGGLELTLAMRSSSARAPERDSFAASETTRPEHSDVGGQPESGSRVNLAAQRSVAEAFPACQEVPAQHGGDGAQWRNGLPEHEAVAAAAAVAKAEEQMRLLSAASPASGVSGHTAVGSRDEDVLRRHGPAETAAAADATRVAEAASIVCDASDGGLERSLNWGATSTYKKVEEWNWGTGARVANRAASPAGLERSRAWGETSMCKALQQWTRREVPVRRSASRGLDMTVQFPVRSPAASTGSSASPDAQSSSYTDGRKMDPLARTAPAGRVADPLARTAPAGARIPAAFHETSMQRRAARDDRDISPICSGKSVVVPRLDISPIGSEQSSAGAGADDAGFRQQLPTSSLYSVPQAEAPHCSGTQASGSKAPAPPDLDSTLDRGQLRGLLDKSLNNMPRVETHAQRQAKLQPDFAAVLAAERIEAASKSNMLSMTRGGGPFSSESDRALKPLVLSVEPTDGGVQAMWEPASARTANKLAGMRQLSTQLDTFRTGIDSDQAAL